MKLAFIQDIATPHNNVLLGALARDNEIDLTLWYCEPNAAKYDFKSDLANAVLPARFYAKDKIDWRFLRWCLGAHDHKLMIVGWMNINTRLLMVLMWLLRRPYNVWFDLPQDDMPRGMLTRWLRAFFYFVLRTSRARVFCVGRLVVDYFLAKGYPPERLVNLPIFVELHETKKDYAPRFAALKAKYGVGKDQLLLSGGSRLVHDKGYDVLVAALGQLDKLDRANVRCVIVGKGEEKPKLDAMVAEQNLADVVVLEEWLEFGDFKTLIAASDAFVHPARFDAFGGTIFAHALGTPVLGSVGAGAALDRVEDGTNGWLYANNDPALLAALIRRCLADRDVLTEMGKAGRATAERWSPDAGAAIVKGETW